MNPRAVIDPHGKNLAFLLSTPRAGSTLLSAILGRHSRVHCPSEPWFLLPLLSMYDEHPAIVSTYDHHVATLAVRESVPEELFLEAAKDFAVKLYNRQLAAAGRELFVDKTPRYYHILPAIQALFPESKKIWLKRNPLDVAASFVSTWNTSVAELSGECVSPSSFDLATAVTRFGRFFHGQPAAYELRYEDLVRDPVKNIRHLCHFLDIEPEPDLENYAEGRDQLTALRTRTVGDKKLFEHARPHAQSIDQWKNAFSRDEVQQLIDALGEEVFHRMGYGETVREIKERGHKFPAPSLVAERLEALAQRGRLFPFSPDNFSYFEDLKVHVRKLRRHWWIRLGRTLGVLDLAPRRQEKL